MRAGMEGKAHLTGGCDMCCVSVLKVLCVCITVREVHKMCSCGSMHVCVNMCGCACVWVGVWVCMYVFEHACLSCACLVSCLLTGLAAATLCDQLPSVSVA